MAWRITHLMRPGRTCPDLDARLFFAPDEIQATNLLRDKVLPANLRFNDMLRQIARLGVRRGRKGDGEPRVKTVRPGSGMFTWQSKRCAPCPTDSQALCITRWRVDQAGGNAASYSCSMGRERNAFGVQPYSSLNNLLK